MSDDLIDYIDIEKLFVAFVDTDFLDYIEENELKAILTSIRHRWGNYVPYEQRDQFVDDLIYKLVELTRPTISIWVKHNPATIHEKFTELLDANKENVICRQYDR